MNIIKNILIFCLFTGLCTAINAQDIITKKNGDEIQAKVLEVGVNDVKYKKYGNDSGPTYTLSKSEIFMIKYENGDKDMFDNATTPKNTQSSNTNTAPAQTVNQVQVQPVSTRQDKPSGSVFRKGHIGLAIGGASLLEEYSNIDDGGFQFNVTFGYLISQHVGITATMLITSFDFNDRDLSTGLIGFLAGPLFSVATKSGVVEFDGKPMIGFAMEKQSSENATETTDAAFAFGIGGSVRWNCGKRISLSGNLDYYSCDTDLNDLSSIGFGVGVNFRF